MQQVNDIGTQYLYNKSSVFLELQVTGKGGKADELPSSRHVLSRGLMIVFDGREVIKYRINN